MTIESDSDLHGLRRAGRPVNKDGRVVETAVHRCGFEVLAGLSGHGIGKTIHEPPTIPNLFDRRLESPLTEGLVVAIEPIISDGSERTVESPDGWTIRTADGNPSAHYEHTIVVTRGSPIVLTAGVTGRSKVKSHTRGSRLRHGQRDRLSVRHRPLRQQCALYPRRKIYAGWTSGMLSGVLGAFP
jgi:Metallopeptidase family M24